jgi:phosphoenolpyruvate synthase/pyruvate phosphate dikinase
MIPLAEAADRPLAEVGGKAQALGRLLRAGAPVPPGFVVPPASDPQAALAAFDSLGSERVAVRSSAAGEDSKAKSWAGQFESYLYVTRAELLERIADCRRSGQSARAQGYDAAGRAMPIAVVVQAMVAADTAGVIFTANPVSGNLTQVMIEAVRGLGEPLVSGAVIPDNYVLDKPSHDAIAEHVRGEAVLTTQERRQLAETASKLEAKLGHPLDIEWAFAEGKLYILQARPITTLPGSAL